MTPWATGAQLRELPSMVDLPEPQADIAVQIATDNLRQLTGNQFGVTETTVRPTGCGHTCDPGPPSDRAIVGWGLGLPLGRIVGPWPLPGPYGGMASMCSGCDCWHSDAVELPGPVVWDGEHAITIKQDGLTLASDGTDWVLVLDSGKNLIVRLGGGGFPRCQDLRKLDDQPGTCSITYSRGTAVPAAGVHACKTLAGEIAKLNRWCPGECMLPRRVTSVQRQGVSVAMILDPMEIIRYGGTGLSDVDMFIFAVNPNGLRSGATITRPGGRSNTSVVRTHA